MLRLQFAGGSVPPNGAKLKLWFKEGGAIAFYTQLNHFLTSPAGPLRRDTPPRPPPSPRR